jgi:hypothetical protein
VRWRRQLAESHYGRGDIHAQGIAVRRALNVAGQRQSVSLEGGCSWPCSRSLVRLQSGSVPIGALGREK